MTTGETLVSAPFSWLAWTTSAVIVAALVPAGLRWLRVAQREHYLGTAVVRFVPRWWVRDPRNLALIALGLVGVVVSWWWPIAGLATAVVLVSGPLGLGIRGRTSRLVFTRRLKTLGAVWVALETVVVVIGGFARHLAAFSALALFASPLLVAAACLLMAPVERRVGLRYVKSASSRLAKVRPRIVGVTGSFGKTSTKNHLAHLLTGPMSVVASPASFNNQAGLARAVNEHLAVGTDVFIAEMGTYGPGEIAALCRWCPPEIAVITAIGPVHLERFGSEDRIVAAKAEIFEHAHVAVLNVDFPALSELAGTLRDEVVVRCSASDTSADVCVRRNGESVSVFVRGEEVARDVSVGVGIQGGNLACALAVAEQLGVPIADAMARVQTLPPVPNRLVVEIAPSGVVVIDDTFNSNPTGAQAALETLGATTVGGRRVVVTPGMVELGPRQDAENQAFAASAKEVATDLVVVGRTNRASLLAGARGQGITVANRDEAVRWVRSNLGANDVVLYENDLPDHYP